MTTRHGDATGSPVAPHTRSVPARARSILDLDPPILELGGPDHRAYLTFYLTLLVLLVSKRDWVRRRRELMDRILTGTIVVQQTTLYGWHLARGDSWDEALPLHICRISTLLGLAWLLTENDDSMQLLFYLGLYAYPSLLVPLDIATADTMAGWNFAVNHVMTVLLPIYACIVDGWVPTRAGAVKAFAAFVAYLGVAEATNRRTGGNYYYLRDKPFLRHWSHRRYLVTAAGVGAGLFGAAYAVSRLVLRRRHGLGPAV
ncbi:TMEM164-related integral membrane acyltransferase [Ornithinimicrobium panacihumi]|uniref:TMEM164-related integral membrane acyltransferase n=1 Tax=Ornithinimicrobium panacihumi TaxID=2008449 RepID=UPI003F894DB5